MSMPALQRRKVGLAVGTPPETRTPHWLPFAWTAFVVAALLLLPLLALTAWAAVVAIGALALLAGTAPAARGFSWLHQRADLGDLAAVFGLCAAIVALFRLAFVVFTADRLLGLFLCFAGALVLGVAGPVVYSTWLRHRPLRSLGVGASRAASSAVSARPPPSQERRRCTRSTTSVTAWVGVLWLAGRHHRRVARRLRAAAA